jgi:hypothetical protein
VQGPTVRLVLHRASKDVDEQRVGIRYPSFLNFKRAHVVVSWLGQGLMDVGAVDIG